MPDAILRVALTGGIGTGKSYCLARFAALGAPTIDADGLARQAVSPGTNGFQRLVDHFGTAVLQADGSLDRQALGALVFSDADARRALEAIIHPVVYAAIDRWFDGLRRAGHSSAAIADIPLLFETGRARDFEAVVVAACPVELQRQRIIERNGISPEEADRRIASQLPIQDKVRRAHYVIDTAGTMEHTDRQVDDVWSKLTAAATQQR